jgi:hypothetical protein
VCVCVFNMNQRDVVCTVHLRFNNGQTKMLGDCMHEIAFLTLSASTVAFIFRSLISFFTLTCVRSMSYLSLNMYIFFVYFLTFLLQHVRTSFEL